MAKSWFILHLVMVLFFSSCLFDGGNKAKIAGNYYLHRWEGGTLFYIVDKWSEPNGGGLIEGTVQKVSWSEDYIFVKRKSTFGGDTNGWMIIDVYKSKIVGPFTDEEFERKQNEIVGNQKVKKYSPEKAWDILNQN